MTISPENEPVGQEPESIENDINTPPEANDDTIIVLEDDFLAAGTITGNVFDNDEDADGDTLTVTEIGGPTEVGQADNVFGLYDLTIFSDGSYTVTLLDPEAVNNRSAGSFTQSGRQITVDDGSGGTDTSLFTFRLEYQDENTPPVANDDTITVLEDDFLAAGTITGNVFDNDEDADDDTLTVTEFNGSAANVGTAINVAGLFDFTLFDDGSYTAVVDDAELLNELSDDDGLAFLRAAYTVSDGNGGTDTADVIFSVVLQNEPPVANDDIAGTTLHGPIDLMVLTNDEDTDGTLDPASVAVVSGPSNGVATANADGTVTYAPNFLFTGQDSFTYTVDDDDGATSNAATATVITGLEMNVIDGTDAWDYRTGTRGDDLIQTGGGRDKVLARQGDDVVAGGAQNDTLDGGWGNDILLGGTGRDELIGKSGDDILIGGVGNDRLKGGAGLDTAILAGAFSEYAVTGSGPWLSFVAGPEGTDALSFVELVQFDDGFLDLRTNVFTPGAFATEAVEALVNTPGFSTNPTPPDLPPGDDFIDIGLSFDDMSMG